MSTSLSDRHLVCVVLVLVVVGFVGVGSAQQTANTTANTSTTTVGQDTELVEGTTTNVATVGPGSLVSPTSMTATRAPTPTPNTNDEWQNATAIGVGHPVNGTLPVGDQDWYVFSVESSGRITVRLAAANQTNMSGFLYDSKGNLLDRSYVDPGEQISLTGQATVGGEYYVFVRNEGNTTGAYAFEVSVSESEAASSSDQPQTETETSSGGGPGFGLLGGLIAVIGGSYLLIRTISD